MLNLINSIFMKKFLHLLKLSLFGILAIYLLNSCGTGVDARKYPPDPTLRVKKNMEEGRGFRLMDTIQKKGGTSYEFASANELWRASLDSLDFMPLLSANYSGGIIITDWYTDGVNSNESIKISIRFLTNEIRSDALDIKVFFKECSANLNCKISQKGGTLIAELKKKILTQAKIYEKQNKDKNFKPYDISNTKN